MYRAVEKCCPVAFHVVSSVDVRHNAVREPILYIRSKLIRGHTYYYLVRGERHGKKVRQKVVQYLGGGALEAERFSLDNV